MWPNNSVKTTPFLTDVPQAAASPLHLKKNYPTESANIMTVDKGTVSTPHFIHGSIKQRFC